MKKESEIENKINKSKINLKEKKGRSKSDIFESPTCNFSPMINLISESTTSKKKKIDSISKKDNNILSIEEDLQNEKVKNNLNLIIKYIEYLKNELDLSYKSTKELNLQIKLIKKKSENILKEREKLKNDILTEKKIREEILKENEKLKMDYINSLANYKNFSLMNQEKINEINNLIKIQEEKNLDYEKRNEELRKEIENKEKIVTELQEKIKNINK